MRRFARMLAVAVAASLLSASLTLTATGTAAADPSANAWYQLRKCESGNRYDINTGNNYYGAYQFSLGTWKSVGGTGLPSDASPAEQDYRALVLYRMRGWQPWTCATLVGLHEDSDARSKVIPPPPSNWNEPAPTTPTPGSFTPATDAPEWPGRQYFQGDFSDDLKIWQAQMAKQGYGLIATGYFGPQTEKAALDIQKKAGLNVVGFIGPKTWAAAWGTYTPGTTGSSGSTGTDPDAVYKPQTNKSCHVGEKTAPPWPGKTFVYGETALEIQCFQKQLASRGYDLMGSAYYGEVTRASVLDLQRRNGINESGIGPLTWKAAWEGEAKK